MSFANYCILSLVPFCTTTQLIWTVAAFLFVQYNSNTLNVSFFSKYKLSSRNEINNKALEHKDVYPYAVKAFPIVHFPTVLHEVSHCSAKIYSVRTKSKSFVKLIVFLSFKTYNPHGIALFTPLAVIFFHRAHPLKMPCFTELPF